MMPVLTDADIAFDGLDAYMKTRELAPDSGLLVAFNPDMDFMRYCDESIVEAIGIAKHAYAMLFGDPKQFDKKHNLLPYGIKISNTLSRLAVEEGRRKKNATLAVKMRLFSNHTRRYIFATSGGDVIVKQAIGGFNLYKCRKNKTCGKHVGVIRWEGVEDWLRHPAVIYKEIL